VCSHNEQAREGEVRRIHIFGPKAEHHHIIRLVDYVHDAADPYAAWREGNLALLCHACHMRRHHPVKPILAEKQRRLFA
jgi:hypothetical protein